MYIVPNEDTAIKPSNIVLVKMNKEIGAREFYEFYSGYDQIISIELFENFSKFKLGMIIFKNEHPAKYAINQSNNLMWRGFKNQAFPLFKNQFRTNIPNTVYFKVKQTFECSKAKCKQELMKRFACFGEISSISIDESQHVKRRINPLSVFLTFKNHVSLGKFYESFPLLKLNDSLFRKKLLLIWKIIHNYLPEKFHFIYLVNSLSSLFI
jgi:hypothetical protein